MDNDFSEESITLKNEEAFSQDIGEKIARVHSSTMQSLGFTIDEIIHVDRLEGIGATPRPFDPLAFNPCIEIIGRRRTVARCRCYVDSNDRLKRVVQFDDVERNNSGVGIGDTVSIKKIETVPAEKIILQGIGDMPTVDPYEIISRSFGKPLIKGDALFSPSDVFGPLTYLVLGISHSENAVGVITEDTEIHFAEK